METSLITVEEVAARLKLKRSWVYGHADELGVYRLGKYLRFSWPRVLDFLDRRSRQLERSHDGPQQFLSQTAFSIGAEERGNKPIA